MQELGAAVTARPRSAQARFDFARALAAAGNVRGARLEYEAGLRLEPGNAAAQRELAALSKEETGGAAP